MADDTFIPTWGESSVFVLLTNGSDPDTAGKKKRWFALFLLVLMIVGATVGELPIVREMFPDIKLDMFFFVSITTIIMAWTNLFTELITNNAAAALAFPLALSISTQMGVSPTPFFVVICMAASASFSTPIGYQTNLIVQGIGNYKFMDFVRIGLPLNIITFLISVILIPMIWNF